MSHTRWEDLGRLRTLAEALETLDDKTYLFREAYRIGYPKFTATNITAFVGVDRLNRFMFCWGRDFFDSLLDDSAWPSGSGNPLGRVAFVLAHETLHVVLRHVERAKGKEPKIWNYAADITVNWICQWYGLDILPDCVTAEQFPAEWGIDPAVQTTEEIYRILLEHVEVIPVFDPVSGNHSQWEKLDDETRKVLQDKVTEAVEKAAAKDAERDNESEGGEDGDNSFSCGNLPGDGALGEIREVSDVVVIQPMPWDRMLTRYLGSLWNSRTHERWDRLPTRLASQWGRVVLPSYRVDRTPKGPRILAALDASGSMSPADLDRMRGVVKSLPENYQVTLASFDTECYLIDSLDKVRGGGGTCLKDVDRVAEELKVDQVICFTDGGFYTPELTRPSAWLFVVYGSTDSIPPECQVFEVDD